MKKRYIIPIAGACALAAVGTWRKYVHPPVTVVNVRVKSLHAEPSVHVDEAAVTQRIPAPRQGPIDTGANPVVQADIVQAETVPQLAPPAEPAVFDGQQFVDDIDRKLRLTDAQRGDLSRILKHVGAMQARIDQHVDADERRKLQSKLVYQLIVRLRMILGEDATRDVAVSLTEKAPRIRYE
jgi:hypothetical protein